MSFSLNELHIYPVKSIKGIALTQSQVHLDGLKGDRRYMLVDTQGEFVTARKHPTLSLITAIALTQDEWKLSHPKQDLPLTLSPNLFLKHYINTTIWKSEVLGQECSQEANDWFSTVLGEEVRLVYFGNKSERHTSRRPDAPVSFADGYPFLLTTYSSLEELNRTCTENIQMAQFRPNLVVSGNLPFAEDSWKRIRIGEVEFENVKPCVRCGFTTLDPITAERSKQGEPLRTLAKFRRLEKEGVTFGINLIALNSGNISVGDFVEILEYQIPDSYQDNR